MPVTISQLTAKVSVDQSQFDRAIPDVDAKLTGLANKGEQLGAKTATAIATIGEAAELSSAQVQALSRQLVGVSDMVEQAFGKLFGMIDAEASAAFNSLSENAERAFGIVTDAADKASASVAGVGEAADVAGASVEAAGTAGAAGMERMGGAATLAKTALDGMLNMAGGITAIAAVTAGLGSSFEGTMTTIANNTTMTSGDLATMKQTVLGLGSQTGASFDQLAQGFMHVTNYGNTAADSVNILTVANKAAVATGSNVSDVANILANVLHEFGAKANEAGRYMEVLHLAAAHGNMTLQEFSDHAGRALGVAAGMGVPLRDVAAAMSALTQHGFDAVQAGTQVTNMLVHIANPSKQATEALKVLQEHTGVGLVKDFSAAGLKAKGLAGVLDDVRRATGGNQEAVAALIPAMRGGLGAFSLVTQGAHDFTLRLKEMAAAQGGQTHNVQDTFNRQLQTTQQRFKAVVQTIKAEFIPIGDSMAKIFLQMSPAIMGFLHGVEQVMAAFSRLPGGVQEAVLAVGGLALAMKVLGNPLLGVGAGVSGLVKALTGEGLAGALEGLGGASVAAEGGLAAVAAAALPITLAVAAVAVAVAGLALAWKNDFGHIREHTAAALSWVEGRLTTFGHYASSEMARATKAIVSYWHEIEPEVKQVVGFIAGYVETEFTAISLYFHTWGKALLGVLSAVWDTIKGVIRLAVTDIAGHIKIALDLMTGHWGKAWADWQSMTQSEGGILKDTLGNVWTDLETGFTNSLNSMEGAWGAFWVKLRSGAGLGDALKAANDAAQGQGQNAIPAGGRVVNIDANWKTAGTPTTDAGQAILKHIADAVNTPDGQASCAYFASQVMRNAGVKVPLTGGALALRQWAETHGGQAHDMAHAAPGDLISWQGARYGAHGSGNHVGLYEGGGRIRQSSGNGPGHVREMPMYDPAHATFFTLPNSVLSPSAAFVGASAAGIAHAPGVPSGGVTGANITAWEKQAAEEAKKAKKAAADAQKEIDERAKHLQGTVADLNKDFVKLSAVPTMFGKKVADDSKQVDVALQLTSGDLKGVTAAQAVHVLSLARTVDALKLGHDAIVSNAEALEGLRKAAAIGADATDVQKLKYDQARQAAELNAVSLRGLTAEQRRHIEAQREAVAVQQAAILHLTEQTRLEKLVHPLQEATVLAAQPEQKREIIQAAGGLRAWRDLGSEQGAFSQAFQTEQAAQAAEQYGKTLRSLHEQMALVDDGVKREAISVQGGEAAWARLTATQKANLLGQTGLKMAMESLSGTAHEFANKVKNELSDAGQGVSNETTAAAKAIDNLLATDGVADSDPKVAGFIRKITDAAKSLDLTNARKGIKSLTDGLSEGAATAQAKIAGTFDERADALRQYLKQNADAIKQMQAAASQSGQSFDVGAISDQFLKNYDLEAKAKNVQEFTDRVKELESTYRDMQASNPRELFNRQFQTFHDTGDVNPKDNKPYAASGYEYKPGVSAEDVNTLYKKTQAIQLAQSTSQGVFKVIQDSWDSSFGQGFKNLGHTFMSFFKGVENGFQSLLKKMAYDIINSAMQQELARVMSGIFKTDKKDGKPGGLVIPKPTPKETAGDAAGQGGAMATVLGSVLGGGGIVGAIGAMIGTGLGGKKPLVPAAVNPAQAAATVFQTSSSMLLTAGFQPLGLVLQQLITTMGQLITAEGMAANSASSTAGGGTLTAGLGGAGGFAGPLTSILGAVNGGGNSLDGLLGPLAGILGGFNPGGVTGGGGGMLSGAMSVLSPLEDLGFSGLATGGTAYSDKPYVVGEHGPELFTPAQTGSIAPNGGDSGSGGGMVIHQHFTINTPNAQSFGAAQSQILEKGYNAARKAASRDGRN